MVSRRKVNKCLTTKRTNIHLPNLVSKHTSSEGTRKNRVSLLWSSKAISRILLLGLWSYSPHAATCSTPILSTKHTELFCPWHVPPHVLSSSYHSEVLARVEIGGGGGGGDSFYFFIVSIFCLSSYFLNRTRVRWWDWTSSFYHLLLWFWKSHFTTLSISTVADGANDIHFTSFQAIALKRVV